MNKFIGILAVSAVMAASAPALAGYDGLWAVSVVTTRGSCDGRVSMALAIRNGTVASRDPSVSVSGQVADGGAITVAMENANGRAVGSGRLGESGGFGVWRGGPCAGTWTAQRN